MEEIARYFPWVALTKVADCALGREGDTLQSALPHLMRTSLPALSSSLCQKQAKVGELTMKPELAGSFNGKFREECLNGPLD